LLISTLTEIVSPVLALNVVIEWQAHLVPTQPGHFLLVLRTGHTDSAAGGRIEHWGMEGCGPD
jgi:hypothetical protein